MKIIFTAFKGAHNTSFQLVERIGRDTLLLTNSYPGLERDIRCLDAPYSSVCMFGADKTLTDSVRIETCAQYGGETVTTGFDLPLLESQFQQNSVAYTVSRKPAGYFCNAAYYHMLKKNPNTIFIHIPTAKGMSDTLMDKLTDIFRKFTLS